MSITFGSVCSGIEAASVAWGCLGWKASWLAEIEPFPAAVLEHHYPDTPNLGDMTTIVGKILSRKVPAPDVLVGGTPCQAFSVAGMREGLSDERGALTIKFVELADAVDTVRHQRGEPPAIIVWENVPGVLSSKDNAFGCFLGALAGEDCELQPAGKRWSNAGCVYGPQRAVAWRVLDAQYFGLAQRRKRVFVVASARDGFDPAKILFEFEGVRRDTPPSREAGEETANNVGEGFTASGGGVSRIGDTRVQDHVVAEAYRMVAFGEYADDQTASTMKARDHKDATGLVCGIQTPLLAFTATGQAGAGWAPPSFPIQEECSQTLDTRRAQSVLTTTAQVRRLTPRECERLQGFPDNYTQIPWRDKPATECPDGHRYKALGNSMAVPVMQWIGKRIVAHTK